MNPIACFASGNLSVLCINIMGCIIEGLFFIFGRDAKSVS